MESDKERVLQDLILRAIYNCLDWPDLRAMSQRLTLNEY